MVWFYFQVRKKKRLAAGFMTAAVRFDGDED